MINTRINNIKITNADIWNSGINPKYAKPYEVYAVKKKIWDLGLYIMSYDGETLSNSASNVKKGIKAQIMFGEEKIHSSRSFLSATDIAVAHGLLPIDYLPIKFKRNDVRLTMVRRSDCFGMYEVKYNGTIVAFELIDIDTYEDNIGVYEKAGDIIESYADHEEEEAHKHFIELIKHE
jgi:hypothetical protein